MKFAGIIAEYDPFHNGHAWQLAQAKAAGCRARRRRHELFAGAARARCPSCPKLSAPGPPSPAGLTLCSPCLLPVPARGQRRSPGRAWRCCAAAGCDGLVFGAETPDAALLMEAAELLDSDSYRAALKAQLCGRRDGASPPRGRPPRRSLHPDERVAALLDKPNNNLAVEYCRAIRSLAPRIEAYPLPRQGANHGEALHSAHGQFASASALRKLWAEGGADAVAPYVPEAVFPLYQEAYAAGQYTDFSAAGRCELALLRSACRGKAPFADRSAASPRDWSTVWKPRSVPAPPTTNFWTLSPPSATPGRGCAASPWTPRWATPPTVSPPFRPISTCWEGQKDALPLLKNCTLPVSHSLARLRGVRRGLRPDGRGAACRRRFRRALPCLARGDGQLYFVKKISF